MCCISLYLVSLMFVHFLCTQCVGLFWHWMEYCLLVIGVLQMSHVQTLVVVLDGLVVVFAFFVVVVVVWLVTVFAVCCDVLSVSGPGFCSMSPASRSASAASHSRTCDAP